MAIKKNAAKANIGPKKQVKATFAECTAENPLKCKYHGLKAFDNLINSCLAKNGMVAAFVTDKKDDGYELRCSQDAIFGKAWEDILKSLHEKGLNLVSKGTDPETGDLVYKAQENDKGISYEMPDGEAELEDADTLSSTDAPDKGQTTNQEEAEIDAELDADLLDNFDDLDEIDEEATEDLEAELIGNSDFDEILEVGQDEAETPKELTDEDIKDLVSFKGVKDEHFEQNPGLMESYKAIIMNGMNPDWAPLSDNQKAWWNDLLDKTKEANEDELPALKVLKASMQKVNGEQKPSPSPSREISTQNHEAEMEKCAAKWNNLMDTAINGKHLLGTQYWAETLQPIVDAYNDAVEANDAEKAFDAVYDLKNAVKDAPENGAPKPMTKDSLIAEMGNVISKMKGEGLDLTWDAKKGNALGKAFEDAINAEDIEGAAKALDDFKEYVEFLESGGDAPEEDDGLITDEDVQEFYDAVGVGKIVTPEQIKASKELCNNGTWYGFPPTAANMKWFKENAKKFPDLKFSKAVLDVLKPKKKGKNQKSGAKEALVSALSGSKESMVAEGMLKPLEHDDAKFPQNITQKELDEAIKKGKKLGGHGGLGTRLVEIGGKQYVCKAATGTGASVIRNGFNADMAYRAGGVYAPDAQLYEFGDGKTYKLSEFIPGKRLIDVWQTADEAKRDEIRKELLKGYPLDVLFSNYDVLGTSPEDSITVTIQGADGKPQKTHVAFNNIMIGDDGHAYRVDNDGSFAMTGTGGIKNSSGGGYTTKVEAEKWGNWEDRQWIDDFRILRRNEKNLGIFDRYSTADIFLSAGNINLDAVVGTLPQGLQKALEKPLFEMKQMTWRALNLSLGGYKNDAFVSMALDASYEASKRGLRELCKKEISWDDAGFGTYKESWTNYQMKEFGENPPEKPQNPAEKLKKKLANDEYTGSNIIGILLDAVKTINHHGGVKQLDSEGKPLGNGSAMPNPDYNPNPSKIAAFEKIDREKLEELAKTDENAKKCLGIYDTIMYSKENGWKKPIGQIPTDLEISAKLPEGFQSPTEKKILSDMEGAMAEYAKALKEYEEVLLPEYEDRKTAHMKAEEAKARKSGGSIFHNFNHFADVLITEGVSTDGISHKVKTAGVKPIEDSMSAQKGDSYNPNAVKWKIREMMALGYSAKQIRDMVKNGDLYSGESYSKILDKAKDGTTKEWGREMASQAIYCGLQMLKKENEVNDQIDKDSGVVFLNRNIGDVPNGLSKKEEELYKEEDKSGWVGAHLDSAADCMQFESNSWHKPYKQVYAVPFSRLVCCANDQMANGGDFGYDSEHEWVGNLLYLPCFVYHESQGYTWKGAIDAAQKTSGMKAFLKKFADRLGMFSTHK